MVDFMTGFCVEIPLPDEAIEFAMEVARLAEMGDDLSEEGPIETEIPTQLQTDAGELLASLESDGSWLSVECERQGRKLLLFSTDASDNELVAKFVQELLKRFSRDLCVTVEFGHFCTDPQVGGFGGTGVVITSTTMEWISTANWLFERKRRIQSQTALEKIDRALDGKQWSPDTLDEIAQIVRDSGFPIREPEDQTGGEQC